MRKFNINTDALKAKTLEMSAKAIELTEETKNKVASLDSNDARVFVNKAAKNLADRTATDKDGQARLF